MASKRMKLVSTAGILTVSVAAYFIYSALALQGQGTLAQAPLNVTTSVQPALIMAVDDSGSMDFETVLPTNDGAAWWDAQRKSFAGLDQNDNPVIGVLNFNKGGGVSDAKWKKYAYLFPIGNGVDGKLSTDGTNDHFAIPPIPEYASARSSDVNRAYFNPLTKYDPWIESDGSFLNGVGGINSTTGQVNPSSAPADPKRGTKRVDLTSGFQYFGDEQVFTFSSGMTIPKDTEYRAGTCSNGGAYPGTVLGLSTIVDGAALGWGRAKADRQISGNDGRARCSVGIVYFPAAFYVLANKANDVADAIGYKRNKIENDGAAATDGSSLLRFEIKQANFNGQSYNDARDNFANWFSYYRKRHQATRAGISLAFGNSKDSLRAGYFTINSRNKVTMRDMSVPAQRQALFTDMFKLTSNGGTPNKEAVAFMGEQFKRGREAGDTQPVVLACQKNFGMLFTDGFSNGATTNITTNVDGTGAAPFANSVFADGQSGTMADIAASYYATNLRPDLPAGKVPTPQQCSASNPDPRLDCQRNLHMNFFGITLNGKGLQYGVNAAATADPYANKPTWPTSFPDRNPAAIDDIWHGTINARGGFYNATSPADIAAAIVQVLNAATAAETPSGSIALTGSRVGTGSLVVKPSYAVQNNGTDWYGRLTGEDVTSNPLTGEVSYETKWEASTKLPAATSRQSSVWFGTQSGTAIKPAVANFTAGNLGDVFTRICTDSPSLVRCTKSTINSKLGISEQAAVAYLLGDASSEVRNGGVLRDRTTALGDIVNSSPIVISPTDDYGYRSLRDDDNPTDVFKYQAYLTDKKSRSPAVVVGANDGMLHAFDGITGRESFAYVPVTSVGHLGNLLFPYKTADRNAQAFEHRYFVDGLMNVSDARIKGAWKTVLVGASGAGGRGVYALDVGRPGSFAAKDVLWDINDRNNDTNIKSNIGYVLGKPIIVPVKNGDSVSWKAIFGNGYGSESKAASLFVVDMSDGSVSVLRAAEAGRSNDNGLGNVVALDRYVGSTTARGSDGYADTVYASDQNGAVWKFDLRSPSDQNKPFFVATSASGERQPILGGFEAAAGPGGGVMLFFGTGSFSFQNDPADKQLQTLYGVLDRFGGSTATIGRSSLQSQQILSESAGSRILTDSPLALGNSGWYLDLGVKSGNSVTATGERFVGNPSITTGIVFFPTFDPSSTDTCASGGVNRLYGLNSLGGGGALAQVKVGSPTGGSPGAGTGAVQLVTTGTAPVKDVAILTAPRPSPLSSSATTAEMDEALASRCAMVVQAPGADKLYLPRPCGRQSWRQVR